MAKFCSNCGEPIPENAYICVKCGVKVVEEKKIGDGVNPKSKIAGGLLGIFLGSFGVHNFYLGYTGKAVAQLLICIFGACLFGLGPIVSGVWGLIEGILILTGNINKDANGNSLVD